jgi:hypothetical protein
VKYALESVSSSGRDLPRSIAYFIWNIETRYACDTKAGKTTNITCARVAREDKRLDQVELNCWDIILLIRLAGSSCLFKCKLPRFATRETRDNRTVINDQNITLF